MTGTISGDADLHLIESLRWDGRLHRLDLHLARMAGSAERLGFTFDGSDVRRRVSKIVAGLAGDRLRKIRVVLGRAGDVEVEAVEVEPLREPVPTLLVDVRADPDDELLYHKTDRRRLYEEARARAVRGGYREALLRNTRGEVTEGSFTSLFVRRGGRWYTPPVSSGLLPGVYRGVLLDRLEGAEERALRPADLAEADSVWLCNSVRELKRAKVTLPDGE